MNLATQLGVCAAFVVGMCIVHALGIIAITKSLRLGTMDLSGHKLDLEAFWILVGFSISIFALHLLEIGLFAAFYHYVATMSVDTALFYSASAYTTLGQPSVEFPVKWRLVGAIEGLVGFLLIGWSTTLFVTDINKLIRQDRKRG